MADTESNLDEVLRAIASALERKRAGVFGAVKKAFRKDGARWEATMLASFNGPLQLEGRKSPGAALFSRQGSAGLRGGFFHEVRGSNLRNLSLRKGNARRYAITHELGTTGAGGEMADIVPTRSKYLTIPLEAAMTASGVSREPSARHWPDTFFFFPRGDTGTGYIVQGDGDELTFLYRLVRKVAIPPRLGMRKTHEEQEEVRARDILAAIREGLAQ